MKNLILPKRALCLLLFSCFHFLPFLIFSQAQQKISASEKYTKDSIRLLENWEKYWRFDDNNQHDSAIIICQNMIELGRDLMAIKYDSTLFEKFGKAYAGVGWNMMMLGRYDEALEYSTQSYDTLKSRFGENHIRITEVLVGISNNYRRRGDYDHALEYIYKSLHVMNNILPETDYYFSNNYTNLANIYVAKEDYKKAIEFYKKSIAQQKKSSNTPFKTLGLANAYLLNGETGLAKKTVEETFALNKRYGKSDAINTRGYLLLGKIYASEGKFELAEDNFEYFIDQINKYSKQYDYFPIVGTGYFELTKLYQKRGEYDKAIKYCDEAITSLNEHLGKGNSLTIKAIQQKGAIYSEMGQNEKALANYQKALKESIPTFFSTDYYTNPKLDDLPSNLLVLEALFVKAKAFKDLFQQNNHFKELEAALSTYDLAFGLIDKMRANYFWENSKAELSESIVPQLEEAINTALTFYKLTSKRQYLEQAYQFTTKSKSIILAESIKDLQARAFTGVPESSLEAERHLKEDVSFYEKLIYEEDLKEKQDSVKLFYWHDKLLEKKTTYNSFVNQLEMEYPEYYNEKYKDNTVTISVIQRAMKPGTLIIEYFVGESKLFAFGISADTIIYQLHSLNDGFYKSVKELNAIFYEFQPGRKEDFTIFVDQSLALYETLLAPVLDQFEVVDDIIIIPDGVLNYVPFECLLTSHPSQADKSDFNYRNLNYLLREYSVRYEYSSGFVLQKENNKKAEHFYLGFAPVYKGDELLSDPLDSSKIAKLYPIASRDGLNPLKFNQPEVKNIGEKLSGMYYLGENAVESVFKENAPSYKILHLAMHSLTNDIDPRYSQLVFSRQKEKSTDDGNLQAYELTNMRLNAELAVLSACNTGSGKLRKGEGVMSLSRAFKNAGCPNIVMSLWQANDASTENIMVSFFDNIKTGKGKTDALRKAKLEFLSSCDQQFTHPYYWATFVLIGDNEPINFGRPLWQYFIGTFAIILVLFFTYKLIDSKAIN